MISLLAMLWYRRKLVLWAFMGLVALGVVLARLSEIGEGLIQTRDLLVRSLAFGLLPPFLWALALALAVWKRRSLLKWQLWNRWLAALLGSVVVWGVLAYFSDHTGILAEVTLGGWVGKGVKGSSDVLGVFRLAGMALIVAAVAFPGRSLQLLKWALPRVSRVGKATAKLLDRRFQGLLARWREAHPRAHITVQKAPAPTVRGRPLDIGQLSQESEMPERTSEVAERSVSPPEKAPPRPSVPATAAKSPPASEREATHETREGWPLPALSLLSDAPRGSHEPGIDQEKTARLIERTLGEYGIEVKVAEVKPGPVVTMFGLVPGWIRRSREVREKDAGGNPVVDAMGRPVLREVEDKTRVKVGSIVAREKDLALALAAPSLRLEAPIPGVSLVGIEVPNPKPAIVTLRSVMESEAFKGLLPKSRLALALGMGTGGEVSVADLARMPHLLIAGSTGSGKSVCINSIIACVLMHNTPRETRLLLLDPKRVELTPYNGIPHLLIPVVVEVEMAVQALKGLIEEMQDRYRRMEKAEVRNIEGYNQNLPIEERMPLVVVCVDELADLMMSAPYDIEHSIIKLAQLGRATGIHLVVATQRPSVDVVTGLIKANFPSRISFAVASQVDSRTILDSVGAEKLLGRGDMLFQPQDAPKPRRIQGAFVSDKEIGELVRYWRRQQGPHPPEIHLLEEVETQGMGPGEGESGDELLKKAYDLASHYNRVSASLLQRRLRIGYSRATHLMDLLEDAGAIAPGEPGKSRDVLVASDRKRKREE